MDDPAERVAAIAALEGIDIGVASAILFFQDSERDIVMDEPEWRALTKATDSADGYPDEPNPSDYATYLRRCRDLAPGSDLKALQRALWQRSESD